MAPSNTNNPKLDLESILANYEGRLRIDRLVAIAYTDSHLATDALRLAIKEVKSSVQAEEYATLTTRLQNVSPDDPLATIDTNWVSATTRRCMVETERLEAELKQYKNNLIKESIRMGNEDIGNHYFAMGDYNNAQKCYTRMRESCTTSKQIIDMNLKLMLVAVAQGNWSQVLGFGIKVSALVIRPEERTTKFDPLIHAVTGLAHLNLGHYKDAAESFLSVTPSYMTLEPMAGINFQKQIISPNDIAIYGGLCALSTMDSCTLKARVLDNQPFRQFLELESHVRKAIGYFCGSKFSSCLGILEDHAADYRLDLYLMKHFVKLYQQIRTKSMVQWLSAFSRVTFEEITKTFPALDINLEGTKPATQLAELESLIKSGELKAKIDVADESVVTRTPDHRLVIIEQALNMAKDQEKALRVKLNRVNMLTAGLEVKAPKAQFSNTFGQAMTSDGGTFTDHGRRKEGLKQDSSFMV